MKLQVAYIKGNNICFRLFEAARIIGVKMIGCEVLTK